MVMPLKVPWLVCIITWMISISGIGLARAQTPDAGVPPGLADLGGTPEATPGAGQSFVDTVDGLTSPVRALNSLGLEGLKFLALVIGFAVIVWLVVGFIARRPHELVVPRFTNASGDPSLDAVIDNLSHVGRAELVLQLKGLRQYMTQHWQRAGTPGLRPIDPALDALERSFLPKEVRDQRISQLIASVADVAPGDTKPLIQLLHAVTPPKGTRIAVTLLRRANDRGAVGIGMEITDLAGEPRGGRLILWESPPLSGTAVGAAKPAPTLPKLVSLWLARKGKVEQPEAPPSLGSRYEALLPAAARWLAYQMTEREFLRANWQIPPHLKPVHEARVHYFLGVFKGGEARQGEPYTFFFEEGLEHCRAAIGHCRRADAPWYRPHQCVADTLVEYGRTLARNASSFAPGEISPGTAKYVDAIKEYKTAQRLVAAELRTLVMERVWLLVGDGQLDAAQRLIEDERLTGAQRWVEEARPVVASGLGLRPPNARLLQPTPREVELRSARNSLAIGRATALLLLGGETYTRRAVEEIARVMQRDLSAEPMEGVLIDLAIWCAIAATCNLPAPDPAAARRLARRYLVYGLVKDKEKARWDWVKTYSDLQPIMTGFADVERHLTELLHTDCDLPEKTGTAFRNPIKRVLEKTKWL